MCMLSAALSGNSSNDSPLTFARVGHNVANSTHLKCVRVDSRTAPNNSTKAQKQSQNMYKYEYFHNPI